MSQTVPTIALNSEEGKNQTNSFAKVAAGKVTNDFRGRSNSQKRNPDGGVTDGFKQQSRRRQNVKIGRSKISLGVKSIGGNYEVFISNVAPDLKSEKIIDILDKCYDGYKCDSDKIALKPEDYEC